MTKQTIMTWKAECEEWREINKEKEGATAFDVSLEQRKRMLAQGQRPATYDEIIAELGNKSRCIHGAPACEECIAHDTMLAMST